MSSQAESIPAIAAPGPNARPRCLLLVDDEENILASLKRLLRRDGYRILTANSGPDGLEILAQEAVDVIISDQRMPSMTGVEFLRQAKVIRPESLRIVLSGYTELQSITDAINEGAIYKFLTKPWDDDHLRNQIADAFLQKEMGDENRRLSQALQTANQELELANERLRVLLDEREQRINRDTAAINVLHEVLQLIPWPLLALDPHGLIVSVNSAAEKIFGPQGSLLGLPAAAALPASVHALLDAGRCATGCQYEPLELGGQRYRARCQPLGLASAGEGRAILFLPEA